MRKVKTFETILLMDLEDYINTFVTDNHVRIIDVKFQMQTIANGQIMSFGLLIYED